MAYVHGYSERETQRLYEQAEILEEILHAGTTFAPGAHLLEAGCGVGAQTRLLVKRNPGIVLTCVDISETSLATAQKLKGTAGFERVKFLRQDINQLCFADQSFDHVFVCFVLEHLDNPLGALVELRRVLKTGGTITVIEGDHGSCFWYPQTPPSLAAWQALIAAQRHLGHDPTIGRRLTPLLTQAGFELQTCQPAWLYADRLQPALRDGMVNHIIVPMVQSAKEQILSEGLASEDLYYQGMADLSFVDKTEDGTFFYTWFKAVAKKA